MPTFYSTDSKRADLEQSIRARCESGEWAVGQRVPSVRELSVEFGLSRVVTSEVLKSLVDAGVLRTVPRSGTYVGRATHIEREIYGCVVDPDDLQVPASPSLIMNRHIMEDAFEKRIVALGGLVLHLDTTQLKDLVETRTLPPLAGVFDLVGTLEEPFWPHYYPQIELPLVRYASESRPQFDVVDFDNVDGGHQATRHLIELGHTRIAFLGLHIPATSCPLRWSKQREEGWRTTMAQQSLPTQGLAFHPSFAVRYYRVEEAAQAGREMMSQLLTTRQRQLPTAIVAVNDQVAQGILQTLHREKIEPALWPALVSFDGAERLQNRSLTSLRLPWDELGTMAADVLWSRRHKTLPNERIARKVALRLAPRFSSRADWPIHSPREALLPAMVVAN